MTYEDDEFERNVSIHAGHLFETIYNVERKTILWCVKCKVRLGEITDEEPWELLM